MCNRCGVPATRADFYENVQNVKRGASWQHVALYSPPSDKPQRCVKRAFSGLALAAFLLHRPRRLLKAHRNEAATSRVDASEGKLLSSRAFSCLEHTLGLAFFFLVTHTQKQAQQSSCCFGCLLGWLACLVEETDEASVVTSRRTAYARSVLT